MCVIAITRSFLACPDDRRSDNDMHDVMLIRREVDCLGGERVADSGHTDTPPMHGPLSHVSSRQLRPHLFNCRVKHQLSSTYTTSVNSYLNAPDRYSYSSSYAVEGLDRAASPRCLLPSEHQQHGLHSNQPRIRSDYSFWRIQRVSCRCQHPR